MCYEKGSVAGVALCALGSVAAAEPRWQDLPSAGFVCEGRSSSHTHASVYVNTKDGRVYSQIGDGKIERGPFRYWTKQINLVNEFGHVINHEYQFKMISWGNKFRVDGQSGETVQYIKMLNFSEHNNGRASYSDGDNRGFAGFGDGLYIGDCIQDDEAAAVLVKNFGTDGVELPLESVSKVMKHEQSDARAA